MVPFCGVVEELPGEHSHPGGFLSGVVNTCRFLMDAGLLHRHLLGGELVKGRLLGVGAHVL